MENHYPWHLDEYDNQSRQPFEDPMIAQSNHLEDYNFFNEIQDPLLPEELQQNAFQNENISISDSIPDFATEIDTDDFLKEFLILPPSADIMPSMGIQDVGPNVVNDMTKAQQSIVEQDRQLNIARNSSKRHENTPTIALLKNSSSLYNRTSLSFSNRKRPPPQESSKNAGTRSIAETDASLQLKNEKDNAVKPFPKDVPRATHHGPFRYAIPILRKCPNRLISSSQSSNSNSSQTFSKNPSSYNEHLQPASAQGKTQAAKESAPQMPLPNFQNKLDVPSSVKVSHCQVPVEQNTSLLSSSSALQPFIGVPETWSSTTENILNQIGGFNAEPQFQSEIAEPPPKRFRNECAEIPEDLRDINLHDLVLDDQTVNQLMEDVSSKFASTATIPTFSVLSQSPAKLSYAACYSTFKNCKHFLPHRIPGVRCAYPASITPRRYLDNCIMDKLNYQKILKTNLDKGIVKCGECCVTFGLDDRTVDFIFCTFFTDTKIALLRIKTVDNFYFAIAYDSLKQKCPKSVEVFKTFQEKYYNQKTRLVRYLERFDLGPVTSPEYRSKLSKFHEARVLLEIMNFMKTIYDREKLYKKAYELYKHYGLELNESTAMKKGCSNGGLSR